MDLLGIPEDNGGGDSALQSDHRPVWHRFFSEGISGDNFLPFMWAFIDQGVQSPIIHTQLFRLPSPVRQTPSARQRYNLHRQPLYKSKTLSLYQLLRYPGRAGFAGVNEQTGKDHAPDMSSQQLSDEITSATRILTYSDGYPPTHFTKIKINWESLERGVRRES
jgi:hypothetical protein